MDKSGCIQVKVVVIGQKLFYSDKSCCIRVIVVVFWKVVFGQKWLYSGKRGCIRAKCLYSAEVVVFGQNGCI